MSAMMLLQRSGLGEHRQTWSDGTGLDAETPELEGTTGVGLLMDDDAKRFGEEDDEDDGDDFAEGDDAEGVDGEEGLDDEGDLDEDDDDFLDDDEDDDDFDSEFDDEDEDDEL